MASRGKESSGDTKNDLAADSGSRKKEGKVARLEHCESSSLKQRSLEGECCGLIWPLV